MFSYKSKLGTDILVNLYGRDCILLLVVICFSRFNNLTLFYLNTFDIYGYRGYMRLIYPDVSGECSIDLFLQGSLYSAAYLLCF